MEIERLRIRRHNYPAPNSKGWIADRKQFVAAIAYQLHIYSYFWSILAPWALGKCNSVSGSAAKAIMKY